MRWPDFTERDHLLLGLVLAFSTIGYGLTIRSTYRANELFALPAMVWEVLFAGSGVVLLAGLVLGMHRLRWLGDGLIVVCFVTFWLVLVVTEPSRWAFTLSRTAVQVTVAALSWLRLGPVSPMPHRLPE